MEKVTLKELFEDNIKRWHNREHYDYQKKITDQILYAVKASREGETIEIPIQLPRQCGKTTSVVDVVELLLAAGPRFLGRPLSIGIFAPEKEQATTDFDRLKIQYTEIAKLGFTTRFKTEGDLNFPMKWNSKTIRLFKKTGEYLGEVYIFPISKTSNPESKTLDIAIIEEAQDIDDEKMKKSVFPMLASTNGPRVYVGTAGTRVCYFKRQIENNPRKVIIKLEDVFKQRRAMYERDGNEDHLLYEKFVTHEIQEHSEDSDYIQTQYFGKWIIGSGQFTTVEEMDALQGKFGLITSNPEGWPCYAGIDTAKIVDRTVVTIVRDNPDTKKGELCGWLSLHGTNYEDQFEIITDWLKNFDNIRLIALDATGQGDFMPDKFERHTGYNIERVKFSAETKDVIYKNLEQVVKNKLTMLPDVPMNEDYRRFRQEMLDLEKEYKGRFLSVHHPDGAKMHDDYPDSWALAEYGKTLVLRNEPSLSFI